MARLASKKFSESARPGNDAVNRPEARMRRIYLVPCANQHGITGMRQMTVNNETFPVFHGRQFVDSSNPFFCRRFRKQSGALHLASNGKTSFEHSPNLVSSERRRGSHGVARCYPDATFSARRTGPLNALEFRSLLPIPAAQVNGHESHGCRVGVE